MNRNQLIFTVVVLNVASIVAFELLRPAQLTYDGLWSARTALWAGVLLVDNLLVVWWHAILTSKAVDAAHQQALVSRRQFEMAQAEQEAKQRPCVVIDWKFMPSPKFEVPAGHTYVARNIGAGLALNVVYVENLDADQLETQHIGALESGGEVPLPQNLVQGLNQEDPITRRRRLLIAEPVGGTAWIVSENLKETSGRISHRVRMKKLTEEQIERVHRETPEEYIHRHWPAIKGELDAMLSTLRTEG
ncbi:MAG TPA: hypothetical protein VJM31_10445 [Vicinamibacterales bacterium]|nr:hypothetical protein [Vicinamibacterales bacterium]